VQVLNSAQLNSRWNLHLRELTHAGIFWKVQLCASVLCWEKNIILIVVQLHHGVANFHHWVHFTFSNILYIPWCIERDANGNRVMCGKKQMFLILLLNNLDHWFSPMMFFWCLDLIEPSPYNPPKKFQVIRNKNHRNSFFF